MKILLHAFEPLSRANGPGLRSVVWFQGCTLGCPGCFNPKTHTVQGGVLSDTVSLADKILHEIPRIEGVSISGGEPFQQPNALLDLLERLNVASLSRLVFSGYTLKEIERLPLGKSILNHLDVLVAGRYMASRHVGKDFLGSGNQAIHLLTARYTAEDIIAVPAHELILHRDGTITFSGIEPMHSQHVVVNDSRSDQHSDLG